MLHFLYILLHRREWEMEEIVDLKKCNYLSPPDSWNVLLSLQTTHSSSPPSQMMCSVCTYCAFKVSNAFQHHCKLYGFWYQKEQRCMIWDSKRVQMFRSLEKLSWKGLRRYNCVNEKAFCLSWNLIRVKYYIIVIIMSVGCGFEFGKS